MKVYFGGVLILIFFNLVIASIKNYERQPHRIYREKIFGKRCVQLHNVFREKHYTRPVILDYHLQELATLRAIGILTNRTFVRPSEKFSVSIYNEPTLKEKNPGVDKMLRKWYEETDFLKKGNYKEGRRAARILWRRTKRIGCGIASNKNRTVMVVYYVPPGNVKGQHKSQVELQANDVDISQF